MVRLKTVSLPAGYGGLCCDAQKSHLHFEDLKQSCFELSGDNLECYVFYSIQHRPVRFRPARVARRGGVVDYAEVKGPIGPDELVFPAATLLQVSKVSTGHLLEAVETTAATCGLKERALSRNSTSQYVRLFYVSSRLLACHNRLEYFSAYFIPYYWHEKNRTGKRKIGP